MVENLQKVVVTAQKNREHESKTVNDEIDIIELTVGLVKLVKRHSVTLIVSFCVGLLLGAFAFYSIRPLYKSELVISVPALEKQELQRLLTSFQQEMRQDSKFNSLELELADISTDPGMQEKHSFVIAATASSTIYPQLQGLLIQYLNEAPFLKTDYEQRRHKIVQTIALLRSEEAKITSALDGTLASKTLYTTDFNVAELAKLKLDIEKERIALESDLQNLKTASVIQNLVLPSMPSNKNAVEIFGIAMLGSMLACIIIIVAKEILRLVKTAERKTDSKTVSFFN
jgi:hypothetical protein